MENKKNIIAVLHLLEFPKTNDRKEIEKIKETALRDLLALQSGGIDALIIENEFEGSHSPYGEFLSNSERQIMFEIVEYLKPNINIPLGFCVLLNDYKTALELAVKYDASFIRLDTFVDRVERISDGIKIFPEPALIMKYKNEIGASAVELWVDVHVKHTKMIDIKTIEESAVEAVLAGANGIIVTGNWTGQAPEIKDILALKKAVPNTKIIIGSGITAINIKEYTEWVDDYIIGSAFKEKGIVKTELVTEIVKTSQE